MILMDFGATENAKGFYRGSFYRTEDSYQRRAAVHPVRWADIRVAPSEYRGAT